MKKILWNSIRFKLVLGFLLLTVPLLIFLFYSNYHAMDVVREEVAESNEKMVTLYMGTIDSTLKTVEEYLINTATFDSDIQQLEFFLSEKDYMLAKIRAQGKIKDHILMFESIESIFLYSNHTNDFTEAFKLDSASYKDRENARNYIRQVINEDSLKVNEKGWHLKAIDGEHYLFRYIKTSGTVIGAWLNLETLLTPLDLIDFGELGASFFVTDTGEAVGAPADIIEKNAINLTGNLENYYLSGSEDKFLIIGQPSATANFSLVALIPDVKITENFQSLKRIATFVAFGALFIIPFSLFLLNKAVLSPLYKIVHAMKRIGRGNLDIRIPQHSTSDEFILVNHTFNQMMDQIKELKINIYEERILKQKAELQYLNYQINPHFFMNTLNIIFNLAQVKKYDLVQEMVLCLVRYFRYTLKGNMDFALLNDELTHIKNYLRIQELRFPEKFTYQIEVENNQLLSVELPPVIIQTFVENTIKYAVNMDKTIHLLIKVESVNLEAEEKMKITIQDTGDGFPEHVLETVRAGKLERSEKGEHIGIWNVKRRLQLNYQERARLSIGNAKPNGALVEVLLPVKQR
ncbi:sensor histidine kinase [Bacillus solitudinis]|uniref:sensor histidine kinase n=1 Tax=Bacillus solitudinis TaxID=2014074 RepID=UPI000C2319A9|nr:histidine kinase [Bacillus solitudinis]